MRGQTACISFAAAAVAIIAAPLPATAQTQYTYTATLQALTRSTGAVTASNIVWQCQGTTCQTSGPWPQPGVSACNALARIVGRVTAYGRPGAMLNTAQLAECNQGVTGALTAGPNVVRPQIQATPQIRTPPRLQQPPQQQAATPPPAPRGGPIRTQTLTVTGTGALAPPRPNRTVRVPTTLTVTGTGALPAPRPNRTVRVTTPLTVTGTGSLSSAP